MGAPPLSGALPPGALPLRAVPPRRPPRGPGARRPVPQRVAVLLATVLALLGYALVTSPVAAHAAGPGTLLSQGMPATASSTEGAAWAASNAVDGNANTRWSSQFSDPQWLQVDLGTSSTIDQVVLNWENYATAYQIQVSQDAVNWTTVYSTTTATGGTNGIETLSVSGTGRYVRMYGTARENGYGYSLWEFQVYGSNGATATPTPTPTATPTPTPTPTPTATASSSPTGGSTPPGNWSPVWSDNFAGAAGTSPSSGNWITDTGTSYPGGAANWGTGEVETDSNSTANVGLDGNGHLDLTALKDGSGNWTSGRIETQRSDFAAPAGGELLISASIEQPDPTSALGYWPGFSAMGASYRTDSASWPAMGESDLMEDVNGRSESSATFHCGTAPGGPCNEYDGLTSGLATCTGCQTGYHSYSEVIDRTTSNEQIRWYLDGQQIWQVNESQVGAATWQAAVDHGFYLVFDLAIGGSYPNAVCGCTSPSGATSSGGTMSIGDVSVEQSTGTAPPAYTTPATPTGGSVVKVTGSQGNWGLSVNGAPYQVKGVTWGPATSVASAYMPDLQSMGVNTVRTWGTDDTTQPLLDAAAAYNLKVINGFWLNQGADYVNDTTYKTDTLNSIVQYVNQYKNDPAVLMWDVGNEVILTMQNYYSGTQLEAERDAYAQYVEQIVDAIHAADPNHPVTSTDAWTGAWPYYKQYTPDLDLYAVNSYGAVCNVASDWASGGYTKPYIVTESGEPGSWEVPNDANGVPNQPTDIAAAQGYTNAWNCISGNTGISLGGTLFNYGIEDDFGGVWYNLIPENWKRLSYYAVAKAFGGRVQSDTPPQISSMTLSNTSSVPAGGTFTVSTQTTDPDGDPIRYNLMYGSNYVDGNTGLQNVNFTQTGPGQFTVTAPKELGVWLVYVYAYDGHGNVGIQQESFKVVPPPVSGTDVALGKPTTASSYQSTGTGAPYPPSNATDGNWSTRWASDWSDPQWLEVDLGQVTAIDHVQLGWEAAYGESYQVQVSNDNTNWTTIYSTTSGTGGVDDFNVSGSGRYVRLYLTQRGTTYGYSLYEFGIYSG
ncbi:discoidin domain-containing protein [Streptacidiphilus sp. P02-A3a]|uniref:discoidin domain-containing protein n=1 Tax=Streptacidiphilus sp. P02-A3a TaxID=2704468 RepID=UPI0015FDB296|nr:discoidin domain-containing protein [Streptacidiphilus sp. P02-A3a]QMU71471.1 coagulation factor 5/8 type domain protein [Streptacidiphilus sp. P02-A3a]